MSKNTSIKDIVARSSIDAPHGLKADGTPRRRPANLIKNLQGSKNKQAKDQKSQIPAKDTENKPNVLKSLEKSLHHLGKEAISTLRKGLRDQDAKIRIQAATAATRASLIGLAKDTLMGDGSAIVNVYLGSDRPQASPQIEDQEQEEQTMPTRKGKPVTLVR